MIGVERYMGIFSERFSRVRTSSEMKYFEALLKGFVETRNKRVIDLHSEEMSEARSCMDRVFSFSSGKILPCLCIDGRVLSETVFCLPNAAFRTPAADISDALPLQGDGLFLAEGDFTRSIRDRVNRFGSVIVLLDSHSHCAAKGREKEVSLGVAVPDGGLSDDVKRKKHIAKAIVNFAEREYGPEGREKVSVFQTAFDVHSGFLFMGLERDEVLSDPRVIQGGFTEGVLEELSHEGKILSTALLVHEGGILFESFRMLKDQVGTVHFEQDYAGSMLRFWRSLSTVSEASLTEMRDVMAKLFPKEGPEDVRVREKLLLSNALLGLLLEDGGSYRYAKHRESIVVETDKARGPYGKASPFSVSPFGNGDMAITSSVLAFAASIVRGNRSKGNFPQKEESVIKSSFGGDSDALVKSPVPIFISERVNVQVSDSELEGISRLEWEGSLWADMSSEEWNTFLCRNIPNISNDTVLAIGRLRERALKRYYPGLPATNDLLSGQLALVSALRTPDGEIIAIFPFLLSGYSEKYLKSIGKIL